MPHTGSRRSRLTTSQRIHFRFSMFAVALTFHASSLAMAVITETALQPSTEKPLGLSLYKMHIISARCHASCKEKCLLKCNTSDSTEPCKEECAIPRCVSNCETTGRILRDESRSPDPVYVKGQKMQVTVSTPSAACMYSLSGQEDTTEGSTIILGWNVTVADDQTSSLILYCVVEVYEENLVTGEVKNWTSLDYTNQSVLLISNLSHNSQYKFRVSVVSSRGLITPPVTSKFIQPPKAELPQAPRNISVYQFVTNQTLKAEVKWQLPNNVGCHFKLYWMTSSETKPKLSYKELRDWASYTFEIGQLGFDRNYSLEIQTYDRHFRVSSARALYNFHTLSCLESTQYNYQSCAPDEPQQFQYIVHEPYIVNETTLTNVTLFWKPPLYLRPNNTIEKYVVNWRKDPDIRYINLIKADRGVTLVPNETNEVTLTDIHWNAEYVATVAAESKAGTGHKVSLTFVTGEGYNSQFGEDSEDEAVIAAQVLQNTENVYFATIIPAILTAGSITVCVIYFIKFKKQTQHLSGRGASKREAINPLYEYTLGKQHLTEIEPLIVTDEFEVDYTCLKLTTTLGEGAFGRVMKAEYIPKGSYQSRQGTGVRTVAVKMLKEHATPEERRFLLLEIGTMKTLGNHPNLVSIVACITNSTRPCLIMEYCLLGDLRNYLRQHRLKVNYMTSSSSGVFSGNMSSLLSYSNAGTENLIINSPESHETMCLAEQELLSQTVLLSYARQIALGMEYLNQNRFIHRDLAARNILMVSSKCVKISDFGLSRDVYETNAYQPTSARKLPFKWMPIESIFDQVFTIKSDVWSYGILLWEIVTLGGCPYPGVPNCDLFRLLSEGYRLERPNNCSADIYKIMLACWHPCIDDRPTFTQLKKKIESLLEASCSYIDLSTEVSADYYRSDSSDDQESDFMSGRSVRRKMSEQAANSSLDGSVSHVLRNSKRYSRFDSSSIHEDGIGKICPFYPVSKGPFVLETNGPIPGLSEELLHKALSSVDLAKNRLSGNSRYEDNSQLSCDTNANTIQTISQIVDEAASEQSAESEPRNKTSHLPVPHRPAAIRPEHSSKAKTSSAPRKWDMYGMDFVYPNPQQTLSFGESAEKPKNGSPCRST